VEALLYLTRAGSEVGLPLPEQFDLAGWVRDYLSQWANHPRFADLRLAGADIPAPVVSHPILLGEVLTVLIDNAYQYSAPGSPITVAVSQSETTFQIEVTDRGPGIAAADLPQVFTPFFRTAAALRTNKLGAGLGLSIARRLAEALGGDLSVTSELGVGSRFVLTLPYSPASDPNLLPG
jgi:signal transduction histidine kinase